MRKRYFFLSLAVIIIITGVLVWACKDPTGPGLIERQKDGVNGNNNSYTLTNGQLFSSSYKIPALTVSTDNVIIAAAGVSSGTGTVSVKKSLDNGNTWSDVTTLDNGYSYPFFINSHNGDILLGVTTTASNKNSQTIFYKSSDNGATWTKETFQVGIKTVCNDAYDGYATYGQGIALRHGSNNNRLMFPYFYHATNKKDQKPEGYFVAIMSSDNNGQSFNSVCKEFSKSGNKLYSDDIGSFGSYISKIIELANGNILLNMRATKGSGNVGMTFWMLSTNCGTNWEVKTSSAHEENKNNKLGAQHADFIRYEFNGKDIIDKSKDGDKYALMICSYENKSGYSIMMTTNDFNNGDHTGGTNKKYAYTKELKDGKQGGYPAITVLSNGTIATLMEENNGIVFRKHSFDNNKGFDN